MIFGVPQSAGSSEKKMLWMTGFTLMLNLHHVLQEAMGEVWKLVEAALLKSQSFSPNFRPGTGRTAVAAEQEFLPAAAAELKQPLPFPLLLLQWDRDTQQTALGGMASRRNPKPQLLIPVQPSKLDHCRCGVKKHSNAPEIQPSVILSPTEQRCHTRINSGRLQSLWNSWFLTHHLFIIHFFFYSLFMKCITLNMYCFPGVWRNWNGKFITDPSSQRSQDLFFKYSLIHVNPRVKPVVLGRIKLTQWGGRGGEEKPHNKGWNTWDFLDNLHLMLYLLTD